MEKSIQSFGEMEGLLGPDRLSETFAGKDSRDDFFDILLEDNQAQLPKARCTRKARMSSLLS